MKVRDHHPVVLKKRISACKKRLEKLKKEGFVFSNDINDDLESLKERIMQPSLLHKIKNKKYQILISMISIFAICAIIYFLFSPVIIDGDGDEEIYFLFTIDNPSNNSTIIKTDYIINGTVNCSNGQIQLVQIKEFFDLIWKNATGTSNWNFTLSINDYDEGIHVFMFRCFNETIESPIEYRTITIDKGFNETKNPTVFIYYPYEGAENLSNVININGMASSGTGNIKEVNIRFDNGSWITIKDSKNNFSYWYFNWETTAYINGNHTIQMKCSDDTNESKVIQINITVFNKEDEYHLPDFEEGQYYQLQIPPMKKVMIPGQTYEMKYYHRARKVPTNSANSILDYYIIFSYNAKLNYYITSLEVYANKDWLDITFQENPFITYPSNKEYSSSILIRITEDAPMNIEFSLLFQISINEKFFKNDNINIPTRSYPTSDDVYIYTGQW